MCNELDNTKFTVINIIFSKKCRSIDSTEGPNLEDMPESGVCNDAGAEEKPPSIDKSGSMFCVKVSAVPSEHLKPWVHSQRLIF